VNGDGFAIELALIVALVLLNGFFAGAEIAVISARPSRMSPLAERGDRSAAALLRLKADPDRFLATVQIGVTVVGTLASAVGGVAAVERLEPVFAAVPIGWVREVAEPLAVVCVVFLISYVSLVVGELVPKSLAVRHAETLGLLVARPIERLSRVSRAAVAVLTASSGALLRLFGQKPQADNPVPTLEDLRALAREAERRGLIGGEVVRGALEIQDCEVRTVMTPRAKVVGVARGVTLAEAVRVARESGYSRLPAWERDLDDVHGTSTKRRWPARPAASPAWCGRCWSSPPPGRPPSCWRRCAAPGSTWRSSSTSTVRRSAWRRWRTCSRSSWGTSRTSARSRRSGCGSWTTGAWRRTRPSRSAS
jgi:putative hemolysin